MHGKTVKKFSKRCLVVVDMPYNTYKNPKEALKNAKLILKETKCDGVKLEGGKKNIKIIKLLKKNKIPVMGHLGILPQYEKGKFRSKGKKLAERKKILMEAKILESSGVFSIVLECVEKSLAKEITSSIKIPTIGIGSSVNCDGQVLVTDDLLGLNPINLKFLKKYSNLRNVINTAVSDYKKEVRKKKFPSNKYSY